MDRGYQYQAGDSGYVLGCRVLPDWLRFVASPGDDEDQCELRSVDTSTGRTLWTRPIGEWKSHQFEGGALVCRVRGKVMVLRPDNGQPVAQFPLEA